MTLTGSYGQPLQKDWLKQPLTVESLMGNLRGLERLELSKGKARKIAGRVPRCGYEVMVREMDVHGDRHHVRRLYLTNESNAKYYFWLYESPCIGCHRFAGR